MNYFIHLTNNAVQVRSDSYGSVVKGNIISLNDFEVKRSHQNAMISDENSEKESENDQKKTQKPKNRLRKGYIQEKIKEMIKLSFDSCVGLLNPNSREKCFELFGFDFMIDENYRVWLIECNSVPSITESNPFQTKLFSRLLGTSFLFQMICSD